MSRQHAKWISVATLSAATFLGLLAPRPARADEGMWTLDNLPLQQLRERYGFTPPPPWVEHVQKACLRFGDGGSGSFVSPNGLVLTNHHVALGQLQKMSSADKDYVRDGFFARLPAEEMRCPDLELNQLVSMQDVTARVRAAIQPRASEVEQNKQRKAEMARIEKESTDQTGLRSDVVALYRGGGYWLYRYKKYTDIRLVMAVEHDAAFYGGDPDNFTYPRFDLDFAFFRVYDGDKPLHSDDYFRWSKDGAKDGELVFVAGHPGSTSRSSTLTQLEMERDHRLPMQMKSLLNRRKAYADYAARGPEQSRRALSRIRGIDNSIKRLAGMLEGLRDPQVMQQKKAEEKDLRTLVAKDPKLSSEYGGAWDRIAAAQEKLLPRLRQWQNRGGMRASTLPSLANTIVRYVVEVEKPNEKRLEEFRDSALESVRFRLFSPAPIYPDMEEDILAATLQEALDELGPSDPYVKAALGGRSPQEVAKELVTGTKLADMAVRRQLITGGRAAVEASSDPFILWARRIDPSYREVRTWYEDNVQSIEALAGAKIAQARFAVYGKGTYPDASFTLRLSYGKVAGYEQGTTQVPYKTTFYGLYDRTASFDGRPPFNLPPLVDQHRGDVDLATPLNFVTTNDIIGGNSGSPVLNRDAEYVGLIFDSNIQGLVLDYAYTEVQARAVAVHSSGIVAALHQIYGMRGLAEELIATQEP